MSMCDIVSLGAVGWFRGKKGWHDLGRYSQDLQAKGIYIINN